MLNQIIAFSLKNRMLILLAALAVVGWGSYQLTQMPVDVFPDLNRPTVTIMTEAPGMPPDVVEKRVTQPIEFLLNGATGVQRVRSASTFGLSIVWVEFEWGTDIYRDRQIVAEKLQLARERLKDAGDADPVMTPISSIMGEIKLLGLRSRPGPNGGVLAPVGDSPYLAELVLDPKVGQASVYLWDPRDAQGKRLANAADWRPARADPKPLTLTEPKQKNTAVVLEPQVESGTEGAARFSAQGPRLKAGSDPLPDVDRHLTVRLAGQSHQVVFRSLQQRQMELRTLGEFTVRNRLLGVEGVSQVTVMGGILKQYQIITSPERLAAERVTLQQLVEAAEKANVLTGGGIMDRPREETLIHIAGQSLTLKDIEETPIVTPDPRPVYPKIKNVAEVRFGGPVKRGDGSAWVRKGDKVVGGPAVIMTVQKQPGADTRALDRKIDAVLDQIQQDLPPDVEIERRIFNQADFINAAVDNVAEAIRDGALWVTVVLFLFMWNFRVSVSSLTAMPLSILITILVFRYFGISINTMTLGGIAIAIGDLVDDSIVDIENIYRRLKENRQKPSPDNPLKVIYLASCEVRNSIVYATLIVCLVVFPLFSLAGLEGRMFAPMGVAYITALMASLLVSLTITPVLGSYLLPRARFLEEKGDPFLLRGLKWLFARVLRFTLRHAYAVLAVVAVLVCLSLLSIFWMGGEFLPPFNEGTLTITVQTRPGVNLQHSERVARQVERLVLEVPEVLAVSRRTGRAELDEHAEGVNSSEIDVRLQEHERPRPGAGYAALRLVPVAHLWGYEKLGRPRAEVEADIRKRLGKIPNVKINIGQPISHRLDHIMSGVRAQIAVKVFGPDLQELRNAAQDVQSRMAKVRGVVDLQIEPQVEVSRLRLEVKRREAASYGLAPGDVAKLLETAYKGRVVSQVLDDERSFGLVVWYDEKARNDPAVINQTILKTPKGEVKLEQVATVLDTTGPNTINREYVQRRIVVFCNVRGRDLAGVVKEIQQELAPVEQRLRTLPGNYHVEYGGQFEAQQEANFRLLVLGTVAVVGVFLLLYKCLESWRAALQVLVNIPLAALGSVLALLIVNWPGVDAFQAAPWWQWPRVWVQATTLSVAHWVGFITLIGIVSRNGIMMISHYIHLMKYEGEKFDEKMIVRGTLERLAPVMMTAFTSFIGLLPLLFGAGQTGKEILYPLAVVVFGGMLTSTLLDQIVTPALFYKFGRKVYERKFDASRNGETMDRQADALFPNQAPPVDGSAGSKPEAPPTPGERHSGADVPSPAGQGTGSAEPKAPVSLDGTS
ncbi:MAG: efflux RND transporter permease subunit [Gemmataceae bacterium]|nr:efflux RND transporter permease subunit [Gemmataceae bacterium]